MPQHLLACDQCDARAVVVLLFQHPELEDERTWSAQCGDHVVTVPRKHEAIVVGVTTVVKG